MPELPPYMAFEPQAQSLDGEWSFTTDPHDRGEREAWYERTSGFGRAVDVPRAWQLYGRDLLDYTGAAWYHRELELPAGWAERALRLVFGASDYLTRAWVNGTLVGEHEGGFTPFAFDITGAVRPGRTNHVVVRVYDPRDHGEVPHGLQGSHFTRVSGIWQSVRLEARPAVHLADVLMRAHLNPDRVEVRAMLSAPADGQVVRAIAYDPKGREVARAEVADPTLDVMLSLAIPECHRWHPDDPYLYTVQVEVAGATDADRDVETRHVGVREVMAIDGRLFLNGQPLFLRGAVDHGYWPGALYAPPDDDEIQRELRLAKEAGVNVIRKHGKVEDPRWLDWCDRLGMLIWAEIPSCDRWTHQARRRFRNEMLAVVRRDLHRPCVMAWTLYHAGRGLEDAGEHLQPWLRQLHDDVYTLDPTRPICTNAGGSSMRTDLIDEHHRFVLPEEAKQWAAVMGDVPAYGAPRLASEFGLWGLPALGADAPDEGALDERWWIAATGPAHGDEAKWPRTAEINFERYKLAAVFEDLDNLAKLTQRRLTRGVKGLVEELRRRPAFAGYVGRAFTDTEWEASGWLDYQRRPKLGFEEWASFNGPIAVLADLPRRNFWAGEEVEVAFHVSNHAKNPLPGTLVWGIDGADCDGEIEVEAPAFATSAAGKVTITMPSFGRSQATRLVVKLVSKGWEVVSNSFEITVSPPEAGRADGRTIAVSQLTDDLQDRLRAQGLTLVDAWEPGMMFLTGSLGPDVQAALERGANVVFLAEHGARTPDTGFLSFRELPHTTSWERSASIHYIQWDLFPNLPLNTIMGWEMEDLYPQHVMPMDSYGSGMRRFVSNQAEDDPANILAGYFEGWLGAFASSMLLQPLRHGHLITTTLRLGTQYGHHPIATQLLNRLLTEVHLFEPRTVYQLET
jgi:hypothetical protein